MISVFSSFATDIIRYNDNLRINGGPALWIEKTLGNLEAKYEISTGKSGEVIIEKDGNGQDRGIIRYVDKIPFTSIYPESILLISTLKDEFNLENITSLRNPIFIDIQGFLRQDFSEKKRFDCRSIKTYGAIFIKATREEFSYLDHHEDVPYTFIITNGGDSIELLHNNNSKTIPIKPGVFIDTIGAGDTFLASLCYYYGVTQDLEDALMRASEYTYIFLTRKNCL